MRIAFYIIFLIIVFQSCDTTLRGYTFSRFSLNGKAHNSYIVNRKPKYGDGRKDGCVVMSEINLSLQSCKSYTYKGNIKDVTTNEPLQASTIKITYKNPYKTLELVADSEGCFEFVVENNLLDIQVAHIGYRNLFLDFSHRSLL